MKNGSVADWSDEEEKTERSTPNFWDPVPKGVLGYSPELPTRKTQKVRTIGMLTIVGTLLSYSHPEDPV